MTTPWTIASWNVNSIKVRHEQLTTWLQSAAPDIVAIQETKTPDDSFPQDAWQQLGYHAYYHGQKSYNGVAILSKTKLEKVTTHILDYADTQARTMSAVFNNTLVVNLYVPNGSSTDSDKFIYKLEFLTALEQYLAQQLKTYEQIVVLGDFNIAPANIDVHDPETWHNSVLTCPEIRAKLDAILKLGFIDSFRAIQPDDTAFSWWDYRQAAFRRNMGLRIDLVLASTALFTKCTQAFIDKAPRKNERPSDHTPVLAEFSES